MNIDIWKLSSKEKMNVVYNRFNTAKYIVWDYARNSEDGSFGLVEELGKPIDRGFTHGFVVGDRTKASISSNWVDISVYSKNFPLDDEFENRTFYPYHLFTTLEKAKEYSEKCKAYATRNGLDKPTYEDVLRIVKKYDKKFEINMGKRNGESCEDYKAISNGSCTIFTIDEIGNIHMTRGQMFSGFTIPHIDLLDNVLDVFYNGTYPSSEERNYAMADWCILD